VFLVQTYEAGYHYRTAPMMYFCLINRFQQLPSLSAGNAFDAQDVLASALAHGCAELSRSSFDTQDVLASALAHGYAKFSRSSFDTQDVLASALAHGCAELSRSSLFIHYSVTIRIFSCCFSHRSLRRLLPLMVEWIIFLQVDRGER